MEITNPVNKKNEISKGCANDTITVTFGSTHKDEKGELQVNESGKGTPQHGENDIIIMAIPHLAQIGLNGEVISRVPVGKGQSKEDDREDK